MGDYRRMTDSDRLAALLAEQRDALRHLPAWLNLRRVTQREVAEVLGTSEATVSKWLGGSQQMTVGQLRQIAHLLKAKPEELLTPPADAAATALLSEIADMVNKMDEPALKAWVEMARQLTQAKR
jgi:transcriptional regulator with XRE-family HTH domain